MVVCPRCGRHSTHTKECVEKLEAELRHEREVTKNLGQQIEELQTELSEKNERLVYLVNVYEMASRVVNGDGVVSLQEFDDLYEALKKQHGHDQEKGWPSRANAPTQVVRPPQGVANPRCHVHGPNNPCP